MSYLAHFALTAHPFGLTPNTEQYFPTAHNAHLLQSLQQAVRRRDGLLKVVGDVGTGKTLLCRLLLRALTEETATGAEGGGAAASVAYLNAPQADPQWLLAALCMEFDLPADGDRATLMARLKAFLLAEHAAGRTGVVLVDEAQALGAEGLEAIRLLSNMETETAKLLQIVLVGQTELDALLARPDLRQIRQRIAFAFNTQPLSQAEATAYVQHRLRGVRALEGETPVFTRKAVARLAQASRGVPRVLNILADRALIIAFGERAIPATEEHVARAVEENRHVCATTTRAAATGDRAPEPSSGRWVRRVLLATVAAEAVAIAVVVALHPGLPARALALAEPHLRTVEDRLRAAATAVSEFDLRATIEERLDGVLQPAPGSVPAQEASPATVPARQSGPVPAAPEAAPPPATARPAPAVPTPPAVAPSAIPRPQPDDPAQADRTPAAAPPTEHAAPTERPRPAVEAAPLAPLSHSPSTAPADGRMLPVTTPTPQVAPAPARTAEPSVAPRPATAEPATTSQPAPTAPATAPRPTSTEPSVAPRPTTAEPAATSQPAPTAPATAPRPTSTEPVAAPATAPAGADQPTTRSSEAPPRAEPRPTPPPTAVTPRPTTTPTEPATAPRPAAPEPVAAPATAPAGADQPTTRSSEAPPRAEPRPTPPPAAVTPRPQPAPPARPTPAPASPPPAPAETDAEQGPKRAVRSEDGRWQWQ